MSLKAQLQTGSSMAPIEESAPQWQPPTEPPPLSRQLFVLTKEVWDAVLGAPLWDGSGGHNPSAKEVLYSIVEDLVEFDLFHLAYPTVDFRLIGSSGIIGEIHGLHLTRALAVHEVRRLMEIDVWTTCFACAETVAFGEIRNNKDLLGACDMAAMMLIVALATSNIEKRVILNKRAKLGIGKKQNRDYSGVTHLRLPRSSLRDASHGGRIGGIPRMHLRRGHGRRQHVGQRGGGQIKRIWIAPTLVNADEDYLPRQEYRMRQA
jgi:hypothetical protein